MRTHRDGGALLFGWLGARAQGRFSWWPVSATGRFGANFVLFLFVRAHSLYIILYSESTAPPPPVLLHFFTRFLARLGLYLGLRHQRGQR